MSKLFYRLFGIKRYVVAYELSDKAGKKHLFKFDGHMSQREADFIVACMSLKFPQERYWVEEAE